MTEKHRALLLVDDDPGVLNVLTHLLKEKHIQIYSTTSCKEGLELLKNHPIQVIISDQNMPEMLGTDFLVQVKSLYPRTIRMLFSAFEDFNAVKDALNAGGIYKFITKPCGKEELHRLVEEAFCQYESSKDMQQLLSIYENAIEAVVITDQDSIIQFANNVFKKITEYTAEDLIEKPIFFIDHESNLPDLLQEIADTLKNQNEWHGEVWQINKDGSKFLTWLSVKTVQDAETHASQHVYTFVDLTQQKVATGEAIKYL